MRTPTRLLALLLVFSSASARGQGANWAQFRGPGGRGVADHAGFPDRWTATENVAWKTGIPGRGWSCPVVWGRHIYLTTVVTQGPSEQPRKGLYLGGERPEVPSAIHEWRVYCLELATGKVVWQRTVHTGRPPLPIHTKNSYASETPVVDADRVYCLFGGVGLFALSHSGKLVWEYRVEPRPMRAGWGTASSPALDGRRIYLVNDNEQQSWIAALETATGKEVWRRDRDEKSNWSSPFVWRNSRRTEVVTAGTGKVRSYGVDGNLLWSLQGMSGITIATPYADRDTLYITSGYVGSRSRPIYAIRAGATGDITLPAGQSSSDFVVWCQGQAAPYNPTTLLYGGQVYALLDFGMLSAYDAATGASFYERTRIPEGKAFTASPWAADGKVYCTNEDGVTFVVAAGPKFQLLHTTALADDDMVMATPAVAGRRLIIRTTARVYCIARPGTAK